MSEECEFKVESLCGVRELDGGIPDYRCKFETDNVCTAKESDLITVCPDCESDIKGCTCGI